MARRPTKFERDLADLHGDADIEIIEMEPAEGPRRRYKVVTQEKPFMADYPPFYRFCLWLLGVFWGGVALIAGFGVLAGLIYMIWAVLFL